MKFMLSLLAFGYVALASPAPSLPLHPGGIGGFFKGPNSETIIKGPDGSIITAAAEGGKVETNLNVQPIVVPEPELVSNVVPVAQPVEAVAVPAAVVESQQTSDLVGPSGRVSTQGSSAVIAGPASTTISGPLVATETVVKGPAIVGTPEVTVAGAAAPLSVTPLVLTATPTSASSVSVTATPIATVTTGPISVTPSPLPIAGIDLSHGGVLSVDGASLTAGSNIAVATSPQAVATASASPHLSVVSASAADGASATASSGPNRASAAVENVGEISVITPSSWPVIQSSGTPVISGILGGGVGHGLVGINNRVDLTPAVIQDQLAVDNRILRTNPALVPSANIIPPEIAVTPRVPIGSWRPTPGTLLTTPGLGSVANTNNIQREEEGVSLGVTPSPLPINHHVSLRPQVLNVPNQQTLLRDNILLRQTIGTSTIQTLDSALPVTPNTLQLDPQIRLNPQDILALRNQQVLLNNQIQHAIQTSNDGRADAIDPRTDQLFTPNNGVIPNTSPAPTSASLAAVQQQRILSAELAKSGIDASQLQLANIPLSDVSPVAGLYANLNSGVINDGLTADAWSRYGRAIKDEKKNEKKTKEIN